MKKQTFLRSMPWSGVMACGFSLFGGLSSASAAIIAQIFERPLAPNTHNSGPTSVANYAVGGKLRLLQWRIAPLAVDMDNNGTTDLTFGGTIGVFDEMYVSLTGRNQAWASLNYSNSRVLSSYAVALPRGAPSGPSLSSGNPSIGWFNDADAPQPAILTVGDQGDPHLGNFLPDIPFEQKYLGVRFEREGAMHYGWVGISGYTHIGEEIYIHAWAYESEPDTAITIGQIPEPGAWLLASAGGLLAALRRQRKSGT